MGSLTLFLKIWQPKKVWTSTALGNRVDNSKDDIKKDDLQLEEKPADTHITKAKAWMPWVILSVFVFIWGTPAFKKVMDAVWAWKYSIPGLDKMVIKMPPVAVTPFAEAAVFNFNVLSMAGTGIFVSAIVAGLLMKYSFTRLIKEYWETIKWSAIPC